MTLASLSTTLLGEDGGWGACHASSICRTSDGGFFCVWFAGTREGSDDVAIWGSKRDATGRWGSPYVLAKVDDSPHWNPVLFARPDGKVDLFFRTGPDVRGWVTWRMSAEGGCASWSSPRQFAFGHKAAWGPVRNPILVRSDGAWLAPSSVETSTAWDACVDISADAGGSWERSAFVPVDHEAFEGLGVIQPALWENRAGDVHMMLRSTAGKMYRSMSHDGGLSWSPAEATQLPNNNSGISVTMLSSGRLLLAYNPVAGNWAPRSPLSLALSSDGGAGWEHVAEIETAPGEYSYPTLVATEADGFALSYTWKRERIAFCVGAV